MTYPTHTMKAAKITGLDPIVVRALELVRDGLRSGEIPAENFEQRSWHLIKFQGGVCLPADMRSKRTCQSACCIAGWAYGALAYAGHRPAAEDMWFGGRDGDGNLIRLFMPFDATPSEAARAIDRFLSGKDPWGRA